MSMQTLVRPVPETHNNTLKISFFLMAIVILGSVFQVGHFIEHAIQFGVWLAGYHQAAYMSPLAMRLTHEIGGWLFPTESMPIQMMRGMEILHLIGNSIFLATIAAMMHFVRSKFVRWAWYVEGFHLCEHIMLTTSAVLLNKQIGISTLFGSAGNLGGMEFAVGYRVGWHFLMNLIPSGLIMIAIMQRRRESKYKV